MTDQASISFQFISEPSDVNFGGKVHGGVVMKWIDQTAYVCARRWAESYCVTVYIGGIRFYRPISIGEVVKIDAYVIYTGRTSIHLAVDVYSRAISTAEFEKKTHCVIVFVSVDPTTSAPQSVRKWVPSNDREIGLEQYAIKLKELREKIDEEMQPYLNEMML